MRMSVSAVDFFGIKFKVERFVIVLDIVRSMFGSARLDILGVIRVKEKLAEVVDVLSSATLFNVMVFAGGLDVMSETFILANNENKRRATDFIDPYWKANGGFFASDAKQDPFLKNYTPSVYDVTPKGGSFRMDMALLASIEQGADAIFMITDDTPNIDRDLNGKELKDWEKLYAAWEKKKNSVGKREMEEF